MKNIGEEIKKIIDQKGFKRRDLAHFLDMTEANVSKIYNKSSIDVLLLERISKFLQIPISYFFEEDGGENTTAEANGGRGVAVAGNGNLILSKSGDTKHAPGGDEDSPISEKVKMLERLLEEKERMIENQVRLLEEKERLIQVLMEKR